MILIMANIISEIKHIVGSKKIPMEYDHDNFSSSRQMFTIRLDLPESIAVMESLTDNAIAKEICQEIDSIMNKREYSLKKTNMRIVIRVKSLYCKELLYDKVFMN